MKSYFPTKGSDWNYASCKPDQKSIGKSPTLYHPSL